jgi:hypothetical protein
MSNLTRSLSLMLLLVVLAAVPGEPRQPAAEPGSGKRAEPSGTPADKQRNILFDSSPQERRPMLSAFGILPWWLGFGIGIAPRYTIPLAQRLH